MLEARALLERGELSTASVAERVGYRPEFAFAKAFKRAFAKDRDAFATPCSGIFVRVRIAVPGEYQLALTSAIDRSWFSSPMTLSPGTGLRHDDIVEPLGAGGMGEAYRTFSCWSWYVARRSPPDSRKADSA